MNMTKRLSKAVLALCLALIMACSTLVGAFAAGATKKTPVVYVHGMSAAKIYYDVNTENEKELGNYGYGSVTGIVQHVLREPTIIADIFGAAVGIHPETEVFINKLANIVDGNVLNLDENGNAPKGMGTHCYAEPVSLHESFITDELSDDKFLLDIIDKVGSDNLYCFTYDWRLDLNENGAALNKYIDKVKKYAGVQKVNLIGESEGGAVMAAYLDQNGNDKEIAHLTFLDSAYAGVDVTSLYNGDVSSDKDDAGLYLLRFANAFDGQRWKEVLTLAAVLTNFMLRNVSDGVNNLAEPNAKQQLYQKVLKPLIGNIPVLYEFIPYADYDTYMANLVKTGFIKKSSGVYKKVAVYHKTMGRLVSNLKAAEKKNGIDVAIIANYGFPGLPLTSKSKGTTDILIDTKYASAYATVAPYGETLVFIPEYDKTYVSPDYVIDASTCALPKSTWFVKNINHTLFRENTGAGKFIASLATGEYGTNSISNVKKKAGYSQFVVADRQLNLNNIK